MNANDIIRQFVEYTGYDPQENSFVLGSSHYAYHSACERIEKMMEYDPSGNIAAIYAKNTFMQAAEQVGVHLLTLLQNPHAFDEDAKMYEVFISDDMAAIENGILDAVTELHTKVTGTVSIGDRNRVQERQTLCDCVNSLMEELLKCNVELFKCGGAIGKVESFSTEIHVFHHLSECLLALERERDGMYLCYIDNYGTSYGWFGFFIKSNGTILSVNERECHARPGLHYRNNRFSENKKLTLFPYDSLMQFSGSDYLGYATNYEIDHNKLAFLELGADAYMPLLLSFVLMSAKYDGCDITDIPLCFTDALLSVNTASLDEKTSALIVPSGSEVATATASIAWGFTSDDVLHGTLNEEFSRGEYYERGSFTMSEDAQMFIDMYGKGFVLDKATLMSAPVNTLPRIDEKTGKAIQPQDEYINTEKAMRMNAYAQARAQLAAHIRRNMFEEYKRFGGLDAINKWFFDAVKAAKERVVEDCVKAYIEMSDKNEEGTVAPFYSRFMISRNLVTGIDYASPTGLPPYYVDEDRVGTELWPYNLYMYINRNGTTTRKVVGVNDYKPAYIFFEITFRDYKQMEDVLGPVPKILKGWDRNGHSVHYNTNLDIGDVLCGVGTPFENDECCRSGSPYTASRCYCRRTDTENIPVRTNFSFFVGFGKDEFNAMLEAQNTKVKLTGNECRQKKR